MRAISGKVALPLLLVAAAHFLTAPFRQPRVARCTGPRQCRPGFQGRCRECADRENWKARATPIPPARTWIQPALTRRRRRGPCPSSCAVFSRGAKGYSLVSEAGSDCPATADLSGELRACARHSLRGEEAPASIGTKSAPAENQKGTSPTSREQSRVGDSANLLELTRTLEDRLYRLEHRPGGSPEKPWERSVGVKELGWRPAFQQPCRTRAQLRADAIRYRTILPRFTRFRHRRRASLETTCRAG